MQRKIGVSAEMLGAAVCFLALFGGYTALVLAAGYILLCESDEWLRKTAVKVFALCVLFSLLLAVTGILTELVGFCEGSLALVIRSFRLSLVHDLISVLETVICLVRDILLLLMGFAALHRSSVPVPVADGIADACFGKEKPAVPKNTRRVCAACGKPLEKDAVFCPECGARNEVCK